MQAENTIFAKMRPKAGKRRFTFEVDVTPEMMSLYFDCRCQAKVKTGRKGLLKMVTLPIINVEPAKAEKGKYENGISHNRP